MPKTDSLNLTARRSARVELVARLRKRKKLRRYRAEIHAALQKATRITKAKPFAAGPFRAPDVKTDRGWQVLDGSGNVVDYATSRDKARGLAKLANDGRHQFQLAGMSLDEAMLELGWKRIGPDFEEVRDPINPGMTNKGQIYPVDRRWAKS